MKIPEEAEIGFDSVEAGVAFAALDPEIARRYAAEMATAVSS